jgi:cobalt-zinc-cadmium resistance protein CzcA
MLNKIIDLGVQNRLMVVLALIATLVASLLVLPQLNLDAFPDVTNVQVQINTEARGLAAEEVEQLITFPIEAVMYALGAIHFKNRPVGYHRRVQGRHRHLLCTPAGV